MLHCSVRRFSSVISFFSFLISFFTIQTFPPSSNLEKLLDGMFSLLLNSSSLVCFSTVAILLFDSFFEITFFIITFKILNICIF